MLKIISSKKDASATKGLKEMKLKAKNYGDLTSAVISAAYYARKNKQSIFVYFGNSYGNKVWRSSFKKEDYLCAVNNCGKEIIEVAQDRQVTVHTVAR